MKRALPHPFLLTDFYKIVHRVQYPPETEYVLATWIARGSRIPGIDKVVAFGFQSFIKTWLIDYFNEYFFEQPKEEVLAEYARIIQFTLNDPDPDTSHLSALHDLGYLPLDIRAVAEGTRVPVRVPMLTIENTLPEYFWLPNALETLFSCEVWQACTSATTAREFRQLFDHYAKLTGADPAGVPFQGHDFSYRGMAGTRAAALSGAGHLLSFTGTDVIPSIILLEQDYNANVETELVGTSIPATEHSVMCAYGQDEMASFERIITDVYPRGFVSIVSDTWDLWHVLTKVLPSLKDAIMGRDGKLVIRPDSGDPADIICGTERIFLDNRDLHFAPEEKGVIEVLWDVFGGTVNERGYKVLDPHVGAIYGDAITLERAVDILERLEQKGFCSSNIVLGIGSFTYQYVTRDTFSFALKTTWVMEAGVEKMIFKDPVTDPDHTKKSLTGRVAVLENFDGELEVKDHMNLHELELFELFNQLKPVFRDGRLMRDQNLSAIRGRLASQ